MTHATRNSQLATRNSQLATKGGFTLVELSIVIVIVGLLIGGILVWQSLIQSAALNSTVSQIQQFDAAVMVFKDKYRFLPGDAPGFGGDGDGLIDRTTEGTGTDNSINAYHCEHGAFWGNLFPNEYVTTNCGTNVGTPITQEGTDKNIASSAFGATKSIIIASPMASSVSGVLADSSIKENYYIYIGINQKRAFNGTMDVYNTTVSGNAATKPVELLSLDKKIDDGVADEGYVTAGRMGTNVFATPFNSPIATCASGADYRLDTDSYDCNPIVRMGGQTGQPQ